MSLVVGLGTAAFTAGGGGEAAPGPRITPPVEMYSVEHAITTGEVPFTGPSGRPAWHTVGRLDAHLEAGVFAFDLPRKPPPAARPALLLAAVLAVAVPGFLVTACSGHTRSARRRTGRRRGQRAAAGAAARRRPGARPAPWPRAC